uniref:Uncharacterized protein n=1 Tax=Daphnia galeata TaxID=27404 RepID=A0A8J2RD51_9CRUS|nr:unnamed protein product [Daphnia galeata]
MSLEIILLKYSMGYAERSILNFFQDFRALYESESQSLAHACRCSLTCGTASLASILITEECSPQPHKSVPLKAKPLEVLINTRVNTTVPLF